MTEKQLQNLISQKENQTLEFKESTGEKKEICETICAFANSQGGIILVGVKNNGNLSKAKITEKSQTDISDLFVGFKPPITSLISFETFYNFQGQNILIIKVKKANSAKNFYKKTCWKRVGASNKDITQEIINQITSQNQDWSAQVCEGATVEDLDEEALENAKKIWYDKTGNSEILNYSTNQVLTALFDTTEILNATLILFGTKQALSKFGINNEISFEYRKNPKQIEYDDRRDFQRCFMLEYDHIWEKIDARNEVYRFQKGLIIEEIKKFSEVVLRESILNAVAHRDYESYYASSQIFIKQNPDFIEFQNPGKLPVDPNPVDLITHPSTPRNKKLAEAFQKLRLTNRAGMGIDLIFKRTIQEGKGMPVYTNFHNNFVFLRINSNLQDQKFLAYLYKIYKETNHEFEALELLTLEEILQTGNTNQIQIKDNLLDRGFIEISGTGKGSKLILSKRYYELSGDDVNKYLDQKYDKFEHKDKIRRFIYEFGPKNTNEILQRVNLPVSNRTKQRYLQQLIDEQEIEIVGKQGNIFIYDKKHDN